MAAQSIRISLIFVTFAVITACQTAQRAQPQAQVLDRTEPEGTAATIIPMFHPRDPTLQTAAEWILRARETVDIAMYNMDTSDQSPVMTALTSPEIQDRLARGDLKIRVIFEGYRGREAAEATMTALEEIGLDSRDLASGKKVHHKFAVIDGHTDSPLVITGSANWSLSSRRNYNEAILFVEGALDFSRAYQKEFNLLWSASNNFGEDRFDTPGGEIGEQDPDDPLFAHFNTDNFTFNGLRVRRDRNAQGFQLTRQIERAIDGTSRGDTIKVATTRMKLRPIYNAMLRAAARGVKIEAVVNMDQYDYANARARWELGDGCDTEETEYKRECSTSKNFSHFLNEGGFPGAENITIKLKWFNFSPRAYLTKQMHSKYLIINDESVLTGSFNWSYSAEYNHIENIVEIDGDVYPDAVQKFLEDHDIVYNLANDEYDPFIERLENALRTETTTDCRFPPMALTFAQIDKMLNTGRRIGEEVGRRLSLSDACDD